jgi:septal ring factor EnvC (AmiA/AmiB activator)
METQNLLVERKQLQNIESRLGNVETTLQEILENGELMEERIKEKLVDINDEIVKNTSQVRRLKAQLNSSRYNPITILMLIVVSIGIWTICLYWWRT